MLQKRKKKKLNQVWDKNINLVAWWDRVVTERQAGQTCIIKKISKCPLGFKIGAIKMHYLTCSDVCNILYIVGA